MLCQTFSLEALCDFILKKNSTLFLFTVGHQLRHFYFHITNIPSALKVILQLMHCINYLLTYLFILSTWHFLPSIFCF